MYGILTYFKRLAGHGFQSLHHRFVAWTKPDTSSLLLGTLTDLARSKSELVAENALLRQQLIILRRQVNRLACTKTDRMLLVLLARIVRTWKQALLIVQPETLLRWHRQGFQLYWKYKSRAASFKPRISQETVALIQEMARDNRLWGAERIRGELLKLGIHVCKRTIQKYMRHARTPRQRGQTWATFLQNHAKDIWACDFLQVTDLFFRSLFAFFIIDMSSRRVIHVGVTRSPTDAWTAQQLREATPFGQGPKYLIRDRDSKFGSCFARVAATSGIKILKTPYHAPRANAICERFLGSCKARLSSGSYALLLRQLFHILWYRFVYALFIALCRKERYTGLLMIVEWKEPTSMASVLLLPDSAMLALVSVEVNEEEQMITATARTTSREVCCPICQQPADRVHSKYTRTLADLPCSGRRVRWLVQVRRFWCENTACSRAIFTERLPTCAPAHARRTVQQTELLCEVAFALGGKAGERIAKLLSMATSHDTLLRLMQRSSPPVVTAPRILGLDDFAWKKGDRYGNLYLQTEPLRTFTMCHS